MIHPCPRLAYPVIARIERWPSIPHDLWDSTCAVHFFVHHCVLVVLLPTNGACALLTSATSDMRKLSDSSRPAHSRYFTIIGCRFFRAARGKSDNKRIRTYA